MRYFVLIFLFLWSISASAVEVIASGFGKDFNESLTVAKMVALDKVNGAWINGDSVVRNGMFSEKITQYNGGVIKSYEVLKNDVTFVIIKADVVPRTDNTVSNNSASIPNVKQRLEGQQAEYNARVAAVKLVDNRSRAIAFKTEKVQFDNYGDMTRVIITGKVSYQPMWLNDFKELQAQTGGFNLQSFYKSASISVVGLDGHKVVLSEQVSLYEDLDKLYKTPSTGAVLYANGVQDVVVRLKVKTDVLKNVDKFEVSVL